MMDKQINEPKYKNALLYLIKNCNNSYLGAVKLNKLLYYLDFISFRDRNKSVTGDTYIHLDYGPVPEEIDEQLSDLKQNGEIVVTRTLDGEFNRWEYKAIKEPDLDVFDPYEQKLIEGVCHEFKLWNSDKIVNQTHLEAPWFYSKPYDQVDYKYAASIELLEDSSQWLTT